VINDIDGDLMCFYDVLRDPTLFQLLHHHLNCTPYSEEEFRRTLAVLDTCRRCGKSTVQRAAALFVSCRQSFSANREGFCGGGEWSILNGIRKGIPRNVSAWLSAIDGLPEVHERLRRVLVLNRPAMRVVTDHDSPKTLFYLDPPYLGETRSSPNVYTHEMTYEQHKYMLQVLSQISGTFYLSGYDNDLYQEFTELNSWKRFDFSVYKRCAPRDGTLAGSVECVWTNAR
jgi:DNA adenine methylase